ncbi:MAG: hypothetical protein ABFD98_19765 [Syntrophobacteraceae bacterium]
MFPYPPGLLVVLPEDEGLELEDEERDDDEDLPPELLPEALAST